MPSFFKGTLAVFLPVMVLFSACKSSGALPQARLLLHESAHFGADLTVRVDSIRDSRCPINASCARAGEATANLLLTGDAKTQTRRLLVRESIVVRIGLTQYNITLRDVTPYGADFSPDKRAIIEVIEL